jgi:hypothetical protein
MALAVVSIDGHSQEVILNDKVFSTGSRGYHGSAKLALPDGKRYQLNVMAVEIGSKNSGSGKKSR